MSYKVHFDRILNGSPNKPVELTEEQKKRSEEGKRRRKEWEEKSIVVDGIPGRCMVIDRSDDNPWIDKKLKELWKNDLESILYHYNDIRCLSGTAGYILKMKDGKQYQQVTIMS